VYQERVRLLFDYGLLQAFDRKERTVYLEIGSGYGALASYMRRTFADCTIILVDLPYSLAMAASYFLLQNPKEKIVVLNSGATVVPGAVNLVLPSQFSNLPSNVADMAVNTLSMAEMPESAVDFYCKGLTRILKETGVFFEQNKDNRYLKMSNFSLTTPVVEKYFSGRTTYPRASFLGESFVWSCPRKDLGSANV
jgi:putative sugar O-methyltransferase